ncbi:MAG: hypothetical protein V1789_05330 [PVC group bacterium]
MILPFLAVVLLALGIGGAYQLERRFDPSRYDFAYGMDEYNYDRLAASLTGRRSFFPGTIYSLPGYSALLCLLYRFVGRDLDLVWFLQTLMGALSCGLTFLLGARAAGRKAGMLAALILVFYGPALFYETRLVPVTAGVLTSLLALTWLLYLPGAERRPTWLAGGFFLGLAALFAAGNLLLILLVLIFWVPGRRVSRPPLIWKETLVLLGLLLVLAPAAARNSRRAGGPVALTAHAGINFFIGNNPEANGGFRTPLFLTPSATGIIHDAHRVAEERTGEKLTPGASSRFWFTQGLKYLLSSPGQTVRLLSRKIGLLIGPREYCDIGGGRAGEHRPSQLYGMPLISFSLIVPFAAAGLFFSARRKRARVLLLLYLYLGAGALATALFYYQARTRMLMVPVGAVFAAGGIQSLFRTLRDKQLKKAVPIILLLCGVFIVVRALPPFEMRSETNLLLASAQEELKKENMPAARDMTDRALRLYPGLGGAYLVLGDIALRAGEVEAVEKYYREAERREPMNPEPLLRLSLLFQAKEAPEAAGAAARRALAIDPLSWEAHSLLADSYHSRGEEQEACRQARIAVRLNPNSAKDHNNLALHYSRKGDPGMAEYHHSRAARIGGRPGDRESSHK